MALVHLWRRSSTASKSYLVHKRFHCRCLWNHLEQHLCAETRHKVANTSGAWVIGTHKFSKNTIHNEPELQDTAWWYEPAADISDFKDYCTYCTTYWIPPVPVVPTVWYGTIWLYDGRIALYWIWPIWTSNWERFLDQSRMGEMKWRKLYLEVPVPATSILDVRFTFSI